MAVAQDMAPRIVVVGAGPTGLGAAVRLTELQYEHWQLLDGNTADGVGGLARSFCDSHGFTWDVGGHVVFTHYDYVDDLLDRAVPAYHHHVRRAWVRIADVWVPYPLQAHLAHLPRALRDACERGLTKTDAGRDGNVNNFAEYMERHFGDALTDCFMRPYNRKVWATEAVDMSATWLTERVAPPRVVGANADTQNSAGWGPNARFRFPRQGGTGAIYRGLCALLPTSHIHTGHDFAVVGVDPRGRTLTLRDGRNVHYDVLLSTMPLDVLLRMLAVHDAVDASVPAAMSPSRLRAVANALRYTSTHVIGLGLRGTPTPWLREVCWMYFPELDVPFYRATVMSNYAALNAPVGHWSLMLEVSEERPHNAADVDANPNARPCTQLDVDGLIEECVKACHRHGLLHPDDVIVSRWHWWERRGYPVPTVERDALLREVLPGLREHYGIYSRGRFGAWRYEVANQDHSLMQGVEAVNHVFATRVTAGPQHEACAALAASAVHGELEKTVHFPDLVNRTRDLRRCTLRPAP